MVIELARDTDEIYGFSVNQNDKGTTSVYENVLLMFKI